MPAYLIVSDDAQVTWQLLERTKAGDVRAGLKKAMLDGRVLEIPVFLGKGVTTTLLVNCANLRAAAVVNLPENVAIAYGLQRIQDQDQP